MNKKLIKKCLPGDIIIKSDNTRVASPVIEEKPIYTQPLSKQTYVSADYRSPWLLQQDLKKAKIAYNMHIDEKNKELALQHALGLAAVADAVMLVPDATDLITKGIKLAGKKYLLHKNAKLVSSLLNGTPTVTPIANNVGWGPRYTGHMMHKPKERTGAIVFRGNSNSRLHNPDFPYYFTTDPKYAANYGKVDAYLLDVTLEVPAKYPFINDDAISVDMNFGLSNQNFNYSQPVLKGNDLVTYEMEPSRGIEYSTYFPKLLKLLFKTGGRLISKHATGSPVNNNPLPKMPINTNPVPKKEDKKKEKLIKIDLRVAGNIPPPAYPIVPRGSGKGSGKGYYTIKQK